MLDALKDMKDKVIGIERHYGVEVMQRLRVLRQEITSKVDGGKSL